MIDGSWNSIIVQFMSFVFEQYSPQDLLILITRFAGLMIIFKLAGSSKALEHKLLEVIRMILLLLPPANRRMLALMVRFLGKMSANPDLSLKENASTRHQVRHESKHESSIIIICIVGFIIRDRTET